MSNPAMQSFMKAVLGEDAAAALAKAAGRSEALGSVLGPRTIVGWLALASRWDYEGQIPGMDGSSLSFHKSEDTNLFGGSVTIGGETYDFENAEVTHLAAALSCALGVNGAVAKGLKDSDLVALGKNIDLLVKMQVVNALKTAEEPAEAPGTMPVSNLLVSNSSLRQAAFNVFDGRRSRTEGPLDVWRLEDGRNLLVDGHHRLVDHLARGATSVPYRVVGQGHTDYHATPEESFQYKRSKYGGLERFADNNVLRSVALGKQELPGRAAAPKGPEAPQTPDAPTAVAPSRNKPAPKTPGLKVTKSQAEAKCSVCDAPQFREGRFKGCFCLRDLAKHAKAEPEGDGYRIAFDTNVWTQRNIAVFMDIVGEE